MFRYSILTHLSKVHLIVLNKYVFVPCCSHSSAFRWGQSMNTNTNAHSQQSKQACILCLRVVCRTCIPPLWVRLINAVHNASLSVMKRLASVTVAASSWRFIAGGVWQNHYRERIFIVAEPGFISSRLCLVKGECLTTMIKRLNLIRQGRFFKVA